MNTPQVVRSVSTPKSLVSPHRLSALLLPAVALSTKEGVVEARAQASSSITSTIPQINDSHTSPSINASDVAYAGALLCLVALGTALAAAVSQFKPLVHQDQAKMTLSRKVFAAASGAGVLSGAIGTIASLVAEGVPSQVSILAAVFTALSGAFVCVDKLTRQQES